MVKRCIDLDDRHKGRIATVTVEFAEGGVYRGTAYAVVSARAIKPPPFIMSGGLHDTSRYPVDVIKWDMHFHGVGPLEYTDRLD